MKTINNICSIAKEKENFNSLDSYIDFCRLYSEFIADSKNYEARITSQNEHNYKFYQYKEEGFYNITRPINSNLFLSVENIEKALCFFKYILKEKGVLKNLNQDERFLLNATIYTIQQSIGCALDALPASENNTAKKINGDLFERLMLLIFKELKFQVDSCVEKISFDGFKMTYQHDLKFTIEGKTKAIGSVKTSSKDRIDKVFTDKLFYNKLKNVDIPHFAIFLNDVQRKGKEPHYGISQTFLRGHFKAYTLVMNPLDGVYYCDLRPIMQTDPKLRKEIKRLDHLICKDIWTIVQK